ncbi:hypothetical protein [Aquisphaera insulae]|uniref:hypothetical protein n=1 Tax=Aquisphaera insulae TaxID=2712864 RepID=UPI0013EC09AE|nr:hypothetical protein [Aquisphaera insulae]
MRRWKPRLTVGMSLILVAVVGIGVGLSVIAARRREAFRQRARQHAEEIFGIEDEIAPDPDWEDEWLLNDTDRKPVRRKFHPPGWAPAAPDDSPEIKSWRASQKRRLDYHEELRKKYERAALYPLLPVSADPPAQG